MTGSHAYDYWHHLPPQKGSFLMSERCSFFPPTPRKRPPYVFPAVWKIPGLCWVPTLISWELPGHLSAWHGFRIHQAQETGCTEVHLQCLVAETFKSSFLFFPPNIDRALCLCRQTYYHEQNHEQVMPYLHRVLHLGHISTHTPVYGDKYKGQKRYYEG